MSRERRTDTELRLLVLHALRLSGVLNVDAIAERTGVERASVCPILKRSCTAGHVVERSGRIPGWILTPHGRAEHARLLADELEYRNCRSAVEAADRAFIEVNELFKGICTRWQLRPDGSPNDHTDAAYDSAIVEDLEALHPRAVALTQRLSGVLPRFSRYGKEFEAALTRLRGGDRRALTAPLSRSYHDLWMELHQDLMSTLGRQRSTIDGH